MFWLRLSDLWGDWQSIGPFFILFVASGQLHPNHVFHPYTFEPIHSCTLSLIVTNTWSLLTQEHLGMEAPTGISINTVMILAQMRFNWNWLAQYYYCIQGNNSKTSLVWYISSCFVPFPVGNNDSDGVMREILSTDLIECISFVLLNTNGITALLSIFLVLRVLIDRAQLSPTSLDSTSPPKPLSAHLRIVSFKVKCWAP